MSNQWSIRATDERERRMDRLLEATGENTKSKALDRAMMYYIRQHNKLSGVSEWDPALQLTPAQAKHISTDELGVPMFSERDEV